MSRSHDDRSRGPKELFAALVEREERGEALDWEAEFEAHPHSSAALRELHANWRRVEVLFGGLKAGSGALASAARELLGAQGALDEGTRRRLKELSTPKSFSERYAVRELVARGGMGEITRVFDRELARDLAMKTLLPRDGLPLEARAVKRFLQEAHIAARLEHPGILPVHEVGVDEAGRPYFTMPLVRGRTLSTVLELAHDRRSGWSLANVLEVVLKVCDALAYAHDQGVVHRDLKPSNVLVGRFGETYVMDWGLARLLTQEEPRQSDSSTSDRPELASSSFHGPATAHGAILGTVHYMSPEQARGELDRVGPRSDVYSIGAILYHALSGRMPFPGASEEAALAALLRGGPRTLAWVAPDAPVELVSICEKAMAREPADRYAGCAEMGADLRAYMEGRVVAAHERGRLAELRKWVLRHRIAVGLFALFCVLGALAVGVARWIDARREGELALLVEEQRLDALFERAETLWPAVPEAARELEQWIEEAEALAAELPEHELELGRLRATAGVHPSGLRHRFADPADQHRHTVLARHVKRLQTLLGTTTGASVLAEVRERLAFARTVEQRSLVDAGAQWSEALARIASSPVYRGLRIAPQRGLVPLGADPVSGLHEFADLATGEPPRRDAAGRIELAPESGVVLVLVPGTRFRMGSMPATSGGAGAPLPPGADEVDPLAREDERPMVELELEPYFLARHELTRAQWSRITRRRKVEGPSEALLPADMISWDDVRKALERVELVLPTEAQWECAARASTSTRFWCGREAECLLGRVQAGWMPDGRALHSTRTPTSVSVHGGAANGWGFVHVAGNVAEWVADGYEPTLELARSPGDALAVTMDPAARIVRGGSHLAAPADLRCAARKSVRPESRSAEIGVRPARRLRP